MVLLTDSAITVAAKAAAKLTLLNTVVGIEGRSGDDSGEENGEEQKQDFEGDHCVLSCARRRRGCGETKQDSSLFS
jgi:hypothetical protein